MSNSWFPNQAPQQWNTAAGFNPQQPQQGWVTGGGQWQPMQQAGQPGGYVYQPQFTSQAQQFQGPGQQYPGHVQQFQTQPVYGGSVPSSNAGQGFPQQQQHQFPQQQQMAYIQEQQKLLKEEEKKREMEIQRRKLRSMDVSKPTAGSLSFDDLVGLAPSQDRAGDSPGPRSGKTQTASETSTTTVSGSAQSQSQVQSVPASDGQGSSEMKESIASPPLPVANTASEKKQESSAQGTLVQQSENSLEKLMESSLTNLNEPSPSTRKRMVFKITPTNRPLPANSSPKTFSQSQKARPWIAGEADFSGVFSQYRETQPEQDDSFGEFQSVGGGPTFSAPVIPEQQQQPGFQRSSFPQPNTPGLITQNVPGQPSGQAVHIPGQPSGQAVHNSGQPSGQAVHNPGQPSGQAVQFPAQPLSGREQTQPQYFANASVTFTSTHLHPLPSTSISGTTTLTTSNSSVDRTSPVPKGQFTNLEASKFPPLYQEVYRRSAKSGEAYVSTELLFPILMSSQLPKNVLRDLWTVANRKIPGKLDQTELFVLLGLIGLVQSGIASPTPEDLKKAPAPPIPKLSAIKEFSPYPQSAAPILPQPTSTQPTTISHPVDDFGDFSQYQGPVIRQPVAVSSAPPAPAMVSQPSMPLRPTQSSVAVTASSQLLDQLASTNEYKPPPGDKYSVFSEVQTMNQPDQSVQESHSPVLVPRTTRAGNLVPGNVRVTSSTGDTKMLNNTIVSGEATTLNSAHSSFSVLASADTFGVFAQAPFVAAVTQSNQVSTMSNDKKTGSSLTIPAASTSGLSKDDQSWADFASFSAPSSSLVATTGSSNSITTTTSNFSVFDSITIPELAATKHQPPAVSTEELTTVGSVGEFANTGPSLFEMKPESTPPLKKHLTGLEILEEEFSARVAQSHSEKETSGSIVQPLVPESAPLDEFGEFEAYSSPGHEKKKKIGNFPVKESPPSARTQSKDKETRDPCAVWRSCLKKCAEVLITCADTFSGVEEPNVLKEIANSEDGRNKLRGIVEVYRLAKRVHCSLKERDKGVDIEESVKTIQKQWKMLVDILPDSVMKNLYSETVKIEPEEVDVLSGTISTCSICLMSKTVSISSFLSLDGKKEEEYSVPLLFHQGQCYHATCANFWINVVQEELPVLS